MSLPTERRPRLSPGAVAAGAVVVALLWAICYPLITTAVRYAPPLVVAFLRALLAGIVLVITGMLMGRPLPRGRDWVVVLAIGASSTTLGFAGMFLAGGRVSPGLATVLANSQPLLAAAIGYFALREPLTGRRALGMGLAFLGIAVVAAPTMGSHTSSASPIGIAFVLMGAVGVAVGNVTMKRFASTLDPLSATGWQLLVGSLGLLAGANLGGATDPVRWTLPFVLSLAGLAVPGTAVAFALWFALLRHAPLNALNTFSFLTPIFALAIGATFYRERLGPVEAVGALLVIAGAALAARHSSQKAA